MKKTNTYVKWIVLGLLATLLLTACSNKPSEENSSEAVKSKLVDDEEKVYVGFILDTLRDERWYQDKEAFEEEIIAEGGNVKTLAANSNNDVQVKQAELLIKEGVDVLVVVPHDGETAAPIVEMAHEEDIKVIAYDRLIRDAEVDYYVSFDNKKVGQLQAEEILKEVSTGNFAYIGGAKEDNNAVLLREGAMDVLKPHIDSGDIKMVYDEYTDDWEPSLAKENVEKLLKKDKGAVDAIIAANDGTAGGAIEALNAKNLAGKVPVSGQDAEKAALKRVKAGTQTMTIEKPMADIAAEAAEMAMKLANGEDIETDTTVDNGTGGVPAILLDPKVIRE